MAPAKSLRSYSYIFNVRSLNSKPLDKPNLENTIFTKQVPLGYVVLHKPKSSYKSSSDVFLFQFPTKKVFFFSGNYILCCFAV